MLGASSGWRMRFVTCCSDHDFPGFWSPRNRFLLTIRLKPSPVRNFCPGWGLKSNETAIASFVLDVRVPGFWKVA
jgi:hypothetical protein